MTNTASGSPNWKISWMKSAWTTNSPVLTTLIQLKIIHGKRKPLCSYNKCFPLKSPFTNSMYRTKWCRIKKWKNEPLPMTYLFITHQEQRWEKGIAAHTDEEYHQAENHYCSDCPSQSGTFVYKNKIKAPTWFWICIWTTPMLPMQLNDPHMCSHRNPVHFLEVETQLRTCQPEPVKIPVPTDKTQWESTQ